MLKNLILYILTLILCCSLSSNTHNKKSKIIGRWTFVCEINNKEDCEKCLKNISNNKKCTCEEFVLYMYVIEFFHSKKFTISKKNETATKDYTLIEEGYWSLTLRNNLKLKYTSEERTRFLGLEMIPNNHMVWYNYGEAYANILLKMLKLRMLKDSRKISGCM